MNDLDHLEAQGIYIFREAFNRLDNIAMLWSLGKDSNVMMWLARKAFFGHVPFPVVHVDTEKKFPEMIRFREEKAKEWGLNLVVGYCPPVEEMDPTLQPAARSAARKTAGLKTLVEEHKWTGIFAGIRRDEQAVRAKERFFSPRTHLRIHPLLSWTEIDIWRYIQRENIPTISLYFANEGKRYRSLGDQDITFPVDSNASTIAEIIEELTTTTVSERAGRAMDHEAEDSFERLRKDGYM